MSGLGIYFCINPCNEGWIIWGIWDPKLNINNGNLEVPFGF